MIRNEDIDDGRLYQKLHKVSWCTWLCPAESIYACNSMFHPCRKAVSRKKRRYQKDGFDLDLVYLSDRIIVHGFPAVGLEHVYRNPRYEIKRLLDLRHPKKYKVFNFCCEPGRGYSPDVFEGRSERYPFKDHNTPPLETIVAFANNAKYWLDQDPANVCSLHCKAGKGRAGLMSCILLLRSGVCATAKDALDHYDRERVTNNRGLTVTSQRKYVMFYESLWRDHWGVKGSLGDVPGEEPSSTKWVVPEQPCLIVHGVEILDIPPKLLKNIRVRIYKGTNFKPQLKFDSGKGKGYNISFSCDTIIEGNFKIEVYATKGLLGKTVKVLELWHNTLFMHKNDPCVDFDKSQLDLKKSFRKTIGDTIKIRVQLVKNYSPAAPLDSQDYNEGYKVVKKDEEELEMTTI